MDVVFLSRFQFALTVGFHFIFPPITIGMAWMIFWFLRKYQKTGDVGFRDQAKFWLKLFALTFVVGVATGITMEFQFGTNWANYSRFVGDIFGAPLAAEGVLAFFLESTFMGVLLFGWNRFSPKVLTLASLLVALGSTLSAFWIIVANSWMQTPAGFEIQEGRAVLTSFVDAVFNPSTIPRYLHTVDACLVTGSFFIMGISAYYLLKGKFEAFSKRALKVALVFAFVSAALQLPLGHYHGVQVAETQPLKLAAFEGIFETQAQAPMLLFGIPDAEEETVHAPLEVTPILSILVGRDPNTIVRGLKEFPKEDWPPLVTSFFSFHLMVYIGLFFIALTGLGLLLWWKGKLFTNKFFLRLAVLSIPLPILANELGWIAAEVGRQPWLVYNVPGMRVADGVLPRLRRENCGRRLLCLALYICCWALCGFICFARR